MSNYKQDHIVDSNKKVSSVEWLFEKVWEEPKDKFTWYAILEQAKAMHKEEIIKFADDWEKSSLDCKEDLYNKTFGGNK